jgi:hypothetical protein
MRCFFWDIKAAANCTLNRRKECTLRVWTDYAVWTDCAGCTNIETVHMCTTFGSTLLLHLTVYDLLIVNKQIKAYA